MKKTNKILSMVLALLMLVSIVPVSGAGVTANAKYIESIYSGETKEITLFYDDNSIIYEFVPEETATYRFYSLTYAEDVGARFYEGDNMLEWSSMVGDFSFELICELYAGQTYYLEVYHNCLDEYGMTSATFEAKLEIADDYDDDDDSSSFAYWISDDGTAEIRGYTGDESEIIIPSHIDGAVVSGIGEHAFSYNENLTSITIPDTVTSIGGFAFYDCANLANIEISDNAVSIGGSAFSYTAYYNDESNWENDSLYLGKNLLRVNYTVSGSYTVKNGTLTIAGGAFAGCGGLTDITIPESVISIGDSVFYDCINLESVNLPDGLNGIGKEAFAFCESITDITIPYGVTSIGEYAFYRCTGLENIIIPESVTSIDSYAFADCSSLTGVTIPASVTYIGYAFGGCSSLTGITVDGDNSCYSSDEYGVLFNKDKTELICYPAGNPSSSYVIPDSVINVGESAFLYCENLESVTLGKNVETVSNYAFSNCSNLRTVTISRSLKALGLDSFRYCSNISDVYYNGTKDQWAEVYKGEFNNDLLGATFHFSAVCEHSDTTYFEQEDAGCYYDGYTAGAYCNDCGTWISGHEVIYAYGHDYVSHTQPASCSVNGYWLVVCSVCGDRLDYEIIPADGHSWSDWNVTEAATLVSEGKKTRSCSVCGEAESDVIPKLEGSVAEDRNSGVKVEYTDDAYGGKDMSVIVEEDFTGSQYLGLSYGKTVSWNIKTLVDGKEVQPGAPVLVTIPIPDGFNKKSIVIYHINSMTGTLEEIENFDIEGDNIKFLATSFSVYMLVDESSVVENNPSENCSCNCHKTGIMAFFWKIINFFNRLFKNNKTCACGAAHY